MGKGGNQIINSKGHNLLIFASRSSLKRAAVTGGGKTGSPHVSGSAVLSAHVQHVQSSHVLSERLTMKQSE